MYTGGYFFPGHSVDYLGIVKTSTALIMLIKADFEIYFKNLSTFLESISLQSKK